jgi:hypothetical protein
MLGIGVGPVEGAAEAGAPDAAGWPPGFADGMPWP